MKHVGMAMLIIIDNMIKLINLLLIFNMGI